MNEIKNKKAFDKCREVFCVFCPESTKVKCEWVGGVPKCKAYGWKEVIRQLYEMTLAETELSELHAKEMQRVHDMYADIIEHESQINSDNYHNEENHQIALQELRDRAVDAFKDTMLEHQVDEYVDCYILIEEFTKKLNEITINK